MQFHPASKSGIGFFKGTSIKAITIILLFFMMGIPKVQAQGLVRCPDNIEIIANTLSADCVQSANYDVPAGSDRDPGYPRWSIVFPDGSTASGSSIDVPPMDYPVGVSYVTYEDYGGVAGGDPFFYCTFSVTVASFQLTITSPPDVTVNSDLGQNYASNVNLGNPTTSSLSNVTITNDAPATFPIGTTTVTWTVTDECSSATSTQLVTVLDNPANKVAGLYATAVTCSGYKAGAKSLGQMCYSAKSNKVSNVIPGQFFYYTAITAPSASFTIDVIETKSCSGLALFSIQQVNQILLWDPNCNKAAQGTQVSLGDGRITITNATVGAKYILAVKYDSKSIIGSTFTGSASTCTYTFVSKIGGVTVSGSTASIDLVPNCKTTTTGKMANTTTKTAIEVTPTADNRMDVEVFPVPFKDELFLRYKFETNSEVTIEIFDIEGRLLARETDTKVFFDKKLKINNNFKTLSNKVYFVKISSDKGSVTKTVISK